MPQFEWDKSLEDLCSSEKEARDLQEMASMLCSMQKAQPPSSFRDNLKEQLMKKARKESSSSPEKARVFDLRTAAAASRKCFSRPVITAAAAVLLVFAMSLLYNQGQIETDPRIANPGDGSSGVHIAVTDPDNNINEHFATGKDKDSKDTTEPSVRDQKPETGGSAQEETVIPRGETTGETGPPPPVQTEDTLRDEPDFEAWNNERTLALAGKPLLSPVYYNVKVEDNPAPAENVNHSWNPRKFVSAAESKAQVIGSKEWATELLLNEGFVVKEGDYLKVATQETTQGLFAEVFYRSGQSGDKDPILVLHFQEDRGILSYYYKEHGSVAQSGFYHLLSPAKAFERVKELEWYAPPQRLAFSFQEVSLTYYNFTVKQDSGEQISVTLPAYCYLGMDTLSNGNMINVYLPALKY